ncbi:hypothetical protein QUA56_23805, partial [Microcoleus sp. N3A4]
MSRYILDTDCFSLWQQNHPMMVQRVEVNAENLAVTIANRKVRRSRKFGDNLKLFDATHLQLKEVNAENIAVTIANRKVRRSRKFGDNLKLFDATHLQ